VNIDDALKAASESGDQPKYSLRSVDSLEEDVRQALLKIIERGSKSTSVIRSALLAKEHPVELVDQLIARFQQVGLIDDFVLAKDIAEQLFTRKSQAKKMIAIALREKGFASEAIEYAIADLDSDAELESAKALALARISRMQALDSDARSRKLAGFLSRKGYSSTVVWAAIRFASDQLSA
jgi:regulatory protein